MTKSQQISNNRMPESQEIAMCRIDSAIQKIYWASTRQTYPREYYGLDFGTNRADNEFIYQIRRECINNAAVKYNNDKPTFISTLIHLIY